MPIGILYLLNIRRPMIWSMIGVIISITPWILWIKIAPRWNMAGADPYYIDYFKWYFEYGITSVDSIVSKNFFLTAISLIQNHIGILNYNVFLPKVLFPLVFFFGLIALLSVLIEIQQLRILPLFLFANMMVIMFWPWPPGRFLIPLSPFLMAYFLSDIRKTLVKYFSKINAIRLALFSVMLVLIVNLTWVCRCIIITKKMNYPVYLPIEAPIHWSSYKKVFKWLREHSNKTDILASGLDTMMYLYTDLRTFKPFCGRPSSLFYDDGKFPLGMPDEFVERLKKQDTKYLVVCPMIEISEEKHLELLVDEVKEKFPTLLRSVYKSEDEIFRIYELNFEPRRFKN